MYQQIYTTPDLSDMVIEFGDIEYQDGYSKEANEAHFATKACFDRDYTPVETRATRRGIVSMIVGLVR